MVSEDKQQILDIKVKYEDAIYGIIRYKEKIDQLKASIKDLQQQEKDKTITTNEMKVQTEAINATIKEITVFIGLLSDYYIKDRTEGLKFDDDDM